jgi:glutamate--cysteine ligase
LKLSEDQCLEYVHENAFKLRPRNYKENFPIWPGQVGIELEHLAFDPHGQPLELDVGPLSSIGILSEMDQLKPVKSESEGRVMGFSHASGVGISFEPGGQVEIATQPRPCLRDAIQDLEGVQSKIAEAFAAKGCHLIQMGMQPWHSPEHIRLKMSKKRYVAMDQYFGRIGSYGMQMMRQTATLQVNLDFGETEDQLARRYLFSQLVSPFVSAIFANSPLKNGELSAIKSHRVEAWRYIDPCRSGLACLEFPLTRLGCATQYTRSLLDAFVVFKTDYSLAPQGLRFRDWMQEEELSIEDFKTHMSLHFLEVRPRNFLEIRSIDCQRRRWQTVPISFYVALLYDAPTLEKWLDILKTFDTRDLLMHARFGLEYPVLRRESKQLFRDAMDAFERLPMCFKTKKLRSDLHAFYEKYTDSGRVPADDVVDIVEQKGGYGFVDAVRLNALKEDGFGT